MNKFKEDKVVPKLSKEILQSIRDLSDKRWILIKYVPICERPNENPLDNFLKGVQ